MLYKVQVKRNATTIFYEKIRLNCNQAKKLLDGLAHSIIYHFHTTGVIKAASKYTTSVKQKYHTA